MQYTKTVSDTYADTAQVEVSETYGAPDDDTRVFLAVSDTSGMSDRGDAQMSFTPKQARSLARALKRAANVAEGKPAKAKKAATGPEIVADQYGVQLHRNAAGTYSTSDCIEGQCIYPAEHFRQDLARILANGGRVIS